MRKARGRRDRKDLWILRSVALLITVVLWLAVLGGKPVEVTKKVNLDYVLPKGFVLSSPAPQNISFQVSGPRAFLKEIEEKNMSIPIDLSNAKVGDYEVAVREDMLNIPLGLRVTNVRPRTIAVKLDRVSVKRVPIRAVFAKTLPEGLKIRSVSLKPSTLEIRGAQSRLVSVDSIPTEEIVLTPNSLHQDIEVNINLADFPGVYIDDQNRNVKVEVDIEGSLIRKWFNDIPVGLKVGRSGSSAEIKPVNLQSMGIHVTPKAVRFLIEGPELAMSKLKTSSLEVWVEVNAIKPGLFRSRLDWRLPPEVRVVNRSTDYVDVQVPPR